MNCIYSKALKKNGGKIEESELRRIEKCIFQLKN